MQHPPGNMMGWQPQQQQQQQQQQSGAGPAVLQPHPMMMMMMMPMQPMPPMQSMQPMPPMQPMGIGMGMGMGMGMMQQPAPAWSSMMSPGPPPPPSSSSSQGQHQQHQPIPLHQTPVQQQQQQLQQLTSQTPSEAVSLENALDDLCSRFLTTIPEDELSSFERILFAIEQAHWFYLDFYRLQNPALPKFSLKAFATKNIGADSLFHHIPEFRQYAQNADEIFANFIQYKVRVPVYGAILLNPSMDLCVMVKGFGKNAGWAFPRGKVNKDEDAFDCAAREVMEETGFDITTLANPSSPYIELTVQEQLSRLYLVQNVPEDSVFETKTRNEISSIEWHPVQSLPTFQDYRKGDKRAKAFWLVLPQIQPLKDWVKKTKSGKNAPPKSILPRPATEPQLGSYHVQPSPPPPQRVASDLDHSQNLKAILGVGSRSSASATPIQAPSPMPPPTTLSPDELAAQQLQVSKALLAMIKRTAPHDQPQQPVADAGKLSNQPTIAPAPVPRTLAERYPTTKGNLLSALLKPNQSPTELEKDAFGILHFHSNAWTNFGLNVDALVAELAPADGQH
ncbi:hypothetical protein CAOG_008112 [Capsaspora owczarzaki ATCC 30864]|uniref:Nudix hydrolase domain-containing protein n=2 Tax=Capsaspora owczarzaki (strain ATCC 30864) TaxID=595528 RepID=A0A0D2UT15_CAPO3|nr:hypothetical protein CAOG_008112 [Capsaspora owczarzaki ATCC 30864]